MRAAQRTPGGCIAWAHTSKFREQISGLCGAACAISDGRFGKGFGGQGAQLIGEACDKLCARRAYLCSVLGSLRLDRIKPPRIAALFKQAIAFAQSGFILRDRFGVAWLER